MSNSYLATWLAKRRKVVKARGTKGVLYLKTILGELFVECGGGPVVPKERRGQVLPKCINTLSGTKLLQYLKVRRCLPVPLADYVKEKEAEYVAKVTAPRQERPPPKSVVRRLKELGSRFKPKRNPNITPGDLVSAGGCVEAPRSKGGRTSLLKQFSVPENVRQSLENTYKLGMLPAARTTPIWVAFAPSSFMQAYTLGKKIPLEVSMVAELGWKVRGVTKQPARALAEGSAFRRAIYPCLKDVRHLTTADAILDSELSEIWFYRKGRPDLQVFSADFSDATTSLSHEVLAAFGEAFGVPLHLLYEGHQIRGKPVTTGCPMGMPMSWTALSIIHYCIASQVDELHNFKIKGDDLIAYWSSFQISSYKEIAGSVGLVVNEKTWTCDRLGTFCEGDYILSSDKGGFRHCLRRLPTFSLKSFVKNEPFPHEIGERFVSRGVPRELLRDMQSYFHDSWLVLCREKGVNAYAPARFGGLGFVPKLDHPLDELTARIVNASHNGTLVYTDKDDIKRKGLASMCMSTYSRVAWSVHGQYDPSVLEDAFATNLATACFIDAHGADSSKEIVTPGKRVRSLRAFRRRFERSGIATTFVRTSVQKAYDVISRLKPTEDIVPGGMP
jgi:hypothetical protein